MKIDYVANLRLPTYRAHGVQVTKMCEEFAARGHDVRLIVPRKSHTIGGTDDPFELYGLRRNFTYLKVPCSDLLGRTYAFGRLFYWLDLLSFLAVLRFGHYVRSDAWVYVRDPRIGSLFFKTHRVAIEVHELPRKTSAFYARLRRADVVIALTTPMKDELAAHGIETSRIVVAPDGVDLARFEHHESKHESRERLGLPQDKQLAFYIGRLDGWKGVDTLLAATPLLMPEIEVVIIGGDNEEVERLKRENPHVRFLGNRPYRELADNQAAADVLVLPNTGKNETSAKYTSPLKLFAYMVSGIPIVASDLPSIRDVLDETCAFLVPADDATALSAGIREAISEGESAASRACNARSRSSRFTWQTRASRILEALHAETH